MPPDPQQITLLLNRAAGGDISAGEELLPLLYSELRSLARQRMSNLAPGQTLQPTALVHEAYLRLSKDPARTWEGRRHFFFAAARAMHDILVEAARRKSRIKHAGDRKRVDIDDVELPIASPADDMLDLNRAMEKLEQQNPEGFELVLLRYFGSQTMPEIAETMELSLATVERRWRVLRAWLAKELA